MDLVGQETIALATISISHRGYIPGRVLTFFFGDFFPFGNV